MNRKSIVIAAAASLFIFAGTAQAEDVGTGFTTTSVKEDVGTGYTATQEDVGTGKTAPEDVGTGKTTPEDVGTGKFGSELTVYGLPWYKVFMLLGF